MTRRNYTRFYIAHFSKSPVKMIKNKRWKFHLQNVTCLGNASAPSLITRTLFDQSKHGRPHVPNPITFQSIYSTGQYFAVCGTGYVGWARMTGKYLQGRHKRTILFRDKYVCLLAERCCGHWRFLEAVNWVTSYEGGSIST